MREPYYVAVYKPGPRGRDHLVLYGPTDDLDQALAGAWLLFGVEAPQERQRRYNLALKEVLRGWVTQFDATETAYYSKNPEEAGFASFTVRSLSSVRMHPSFKTRSTADSTLEDDRKIRTRTEALDYIAWYFHYLEHGFFARR